MMKIERGRLILDPFQNGIRKVMAYGNGKRVLVDE
jgi:hypothetical protein